MALNSLVPQTPRNQNLELSGEILLWWLEEILFMVVMDLRRQRMKSTYGSNPRSWLIIQAMLRSGSMVSTDDISISYFLETKACNLGQRRSAGSKSDPNKMLSLDDWRRKQLA